jgi:excisionase family DNA binding protein
MEQILFSGIKLNELLDRIGQLIDSKIGIIPLQNSNLQSEYITRNEVAKILKVSLPTLHDYTKQGWVNSYKIGTRVLYKKSEVQESLEKLASYKFRKGGLRA